MMRTCSLCGKPVDPASKQTYRRVQGWEKRSLSSSRRSGSDIVLREQVGEFACGVCIERAKSGLAPSQEALAL